MALIWIDDEATAERSEVQPTEHQTAEHRARTLRCEMGDVRPMKLEEGEDNPFPFGVPKKAVQRPLKGWESEGLKKRLRDAEKEKRPDKSIRNFEWMTNTKEDDAMIKRDVPKKGTHSTVWEEVMKYAYNEIRERIGA